MIDYNSLRSWQVGAYHEWAKVRNGIFLGCTGSGKSIAAMFCMQNVDVHTIIVVPTIALMNQWRDEIAKHYSLELEDVGAIGNGLRIIKHYTVAVINSVRMMNLDYFDMIILDEAHRYGSIENILPLMRNNFKYKLGITATLKRSDGEHKKLEDLIGPVVYEYNTADAVKDGVLSEFEIINVAVDLLPAERIKYDKHTRTIDLNSFQGMFQIVYNQGHPKWHEAVAAVRATTWRKGVISNAKKKLDALVSLVGENKDKKIIVFNETIKMAEAEKKALEKKGFVCEIYHSKMKKQDAIERFKSGEVKILISVKSLNEGLDVKDVDVGIRVAGTNQDRDTIQRLGRGLRVVDGKTSAKYYQIYCDNTVEKYQVTRSTNTIKAASSKVSWIERKV